jgi:hypothetical protein
MWSPAQVLNFMFVSPQYRVLYVNIVTLFWNIILSTLLFAVSRYDGVIFVENLSDKVFHSRATKKGRK